MVSLSLPDVEKLLDKVLGFRPTQSDMDIVLKAEQLTGKKRSDLLRACFYHSIQTVVDNLDQQRQELREDFDRTLSTTAQLRPEKNVTYKIKRSTTDPPKRKAG